MVLEAHEGHVAHPGVEHAWEPLRGLYEGAALYALQRLLHEVLINVVEHLDEGAVPDQHPPALSLCVLKQSPVNVNVDPVRYYEQPHSLLLGPARGGWRPSGLLSRGCPLSLYHLYGLVGPPAQLRQLVLAWGVPGHQGRQLPEVECHGARVLDVGGLHELSEGHVSPLAQGLHYGPPGRVRYGLVDVLGQPPTRSVSLKGSSKISSSDEAPKHAEAPRDEAPRQLKARTRLDLEGFKNYLNFISTK